MRLRPLIFLAAPLVAYACATTNDSNEPSGGSDASIDRLHIDPPETAPPKDATKDAKPKDAGKPDTGSEGDPCSLGASELSSCGICGKHERACLAGKDGGGAWGPWGSCQGQVTTPDACDPAVVHPDEACGNCGTQEHYCDPISCTMILGHCDEPLFNGVEACKPGSKIFKMGASCDATQGRYQSCDNTCQWGLFGACVAPPPIVTTPVFTRHYESLCGLNAGVVKCWGKDNVGQLGDGPTDSTWPISNTPKMVQVQGISTAKELIGGFVHGCVLETGGAVKCWGDNSKQQVPGAGARADAPITVAGLSGVAHLTSSGYYTCALLTGGAAKCWGSPPTGVLAASNVPVSLPNASGLIGLAGSINEICGITAAGGVVCWNAAHPTTPQAIAGISSAVEIQMGSQFGCARLSSGAVKCWGDNTFGQLGDGTTTASATTAVTAIGITDAVALSLSYTAVCVPTTTHKIKCWGYLQGITPTPVEHPGFPGDQIWIQVTSDDLFAFTSTGTLLASLLGPKALPAPVVGF